MQNSTNKAYLEVFASSKFNIIFIVKNELLFHKKNTKRRLRSIKKDINSFFVSSDCLIKQQRSPLISSFSLKGNTFAEEAPKSRL
jgi:hypothetical protein